MATLTSGSWSVRLLHATGVPSNGKVMSLDTTRTNRHKIVTAVMTMSGGESPAAGVPWPDKGRFGFIRNLDAIILHNQYPWSTVTVAPITASGKQIFAQSNATGARVRFLALQSATGTAGRVYKQVATGLALTTGATFYVTAIGW